MLRTLPRSTMPVPYRSGRPRRNGRIYVYDDDSAGALTDVKVLAHECMRSGVRTLARNGDFVYSGAEDGTLACWSLREHNVLSSAAVHSKIVFCYLRRRQSGASHGQPLYSGLSSCNEQLRAREEDVISIEASCSGLARHVLS